MDELNSFHNPQNIETIIEPLDELTDSNEVALIPSDETNCLLNTIDELDSQIEEIIAKNGGLWNCKVCGKTAKQRCDIKDHAETHMEGISHSCHICSKSFSTRSSVKTHIKNVHSQQLFNCNLCGKSEMKKNTFLTHKRECKLDQ